MSVQRLGGRDRGGDDSSWTSTHAARGITHCSEEAGSPLVSCEAAMDVSSGATSTATTDLGPAHALADGRTRSSPESTPSGSQHSADAGRASSCEGASEITVMDLREHADWASVSDRLDAGLAAVLTSKEACVTANDQWIQHGSISEDAGGLYLWIQPVGRRCSPPEALSSWPKRPADSCCCEEEVLGRMRRLAGNPASESLGWWWTTEALPLSSSFGCRAEEFAKQAVELLQPLLPVALLPAANPSGECTNWLAYARSSTAATDLRLQGAGPLGAWGFTKSAAALRPVYLSLPLGPQTQAELRQHSMELRAFRHWVVQLDQDALAGTELLLRSWRADASGVVCSPGAQAWEEIDSRAVVFGPSNALGATAEVRQEPGQLIAFQRQGHCGWVTGGVYLSWNIAIGPDWPMHALREARVRSSATRQAAAAARRPWLCAELGRPGGQRSLHVLRLLFAAACSIPQVHASILEGLRQHFLPLCEAELERQQDDSLAQLNARRGLLECQNPAALTCSCCGGEFIFSYVCLVERKGERDGSFCWQCWSLRRKIGLEGAGGPPRNARKCTIVAAAELKRLIAIIRSVRPAKRSRQV